MPFLFQSLAAAYADSNEADLRYEERLTRVAFLRTVRRIRHFIGIVRKKDASVEAVEDCTIDGMAVPVFN